MALPSLADMQQQSALSAADGHGSQSSYGGTTGGLLLSGMGSGDPTLDVPPFAYTFTPMSNTSGSFGVNSDVIRIPEAFQPVSDGRRDGRTDSPNDGSFSRSWKRPRPAPEIVHTEIDFPANRDGLALLSVIAGLELEK
jgi:hypothetical protein